MKKISTLLLLMISICSQTHAQPTVQASLGIGSTPMRVDIYIKCNTTLTTNISNLEFNIAVADTDNIPKPTVISSHGSSDWNISGPNAEGGFNNFYISSGNSQFVYQLSANAEFKVMEIEFPGHTILPKELSLVTLPNGGGNGFAIFIAKGTPSSDGSNLYYNRPGTVLDNEFSYDQTNPQNLGTSTSSVNLVELILPIKLSSFKTRSSKNNSVLNWSVQNQDATSGYFDIERSTNGNDFTKIGTVVSNGLPTGNYSYTDENSGLAGTVYYRLKIVDKDGKFVYSEIKTVQLNNPDYGAIIYPNPLTKISKLVINLESSQIVKVVVNNALGKMVKELEFSGIKGRNEKSLDLTSLANGSYFIRVESGNSIQTLSAIKN
ncbi:MAG: T9SS type A sorting domain-containing protein [Ginsengibacter sp.]